MLPSDDIYRERFEVKGVVQGVGFRPFVFSLAHRLGLRGFVRNHSCGVTIEIEGGRHHLSQFFSCLQGESPPLARIDSVELSSIPPLGCSEFRIIASEAVVAASTPISSDIATCEACMAEVEDRFNRRYRYPFTNCTNCGPRYTIVRDVPYDRPLTTMCDFIMCCECDREYHEPTDRRYHAQPNACPKCGPTVWFVDELDAIHVAAFTRAGRAVGEEAIRAFHRSIDADAIVATKGIGGFHLACSAESSNAIETLRNRKGRVDKPLAIMVSDVASAREFALVSPDEERLLRCRERPIVLLQRRPDCRLPEELAPANDFIGIMLPYSPLHSLLVERKPLVMTSGNISEEPIARTNSEAFERLQSLADTFLLHNREIHVVCDDSVVRVTRGIELPIRRSRGYAPVPIRLNESVPNILAVGGELKAAFCMTQGKYATMSPHIGDMGNLETLEAFGRGVEHFQRLYRIQPEIIACDMHPAYLSSQWARKRASADGLPLVEVQHHHAHIASVLAEYRIDRATSVIGISFDGTGYGTDGTIWGGEVLIANLSSYQRWAHLQYVPLAGGDASLKHPYRFALSHLRSAGLAWDSRLPCVAHCSEKERIALWCQLERNLNCVPTSSIGRLFDAVAALIGTRQSVSYEAQAALEMEAISADLRFAIPYTFAFSEGDPHVFDPAPMLEAVVRDVIVGVPRSVIAARFHSSITRVLVDMCARIRNEQDLHQVALSGGVFQNAKLLHHTILSLEGSGFEVLTHRIVPPNDGGLALGQAMIAAASVDSA